MDSATFRASLAGTTIGRLLTDPATVRAIEQAGAMDRPAVEVIDRAVGDVVGSLSDEERKAAGRLVKQLLARHGLRPVKKGQRVLHGRVFTSGSVYGPVARPAPNFGLRPPSAAERGDAIVARLRAIRVGNAGSVADFIAERRDAARRELTEGA
jgi:hypothetical protein